MTSRKRLTLSQAACLLENDSENEDSEENDAEDGEDQRDCDSTEETLFAEPSDGEIEMYETESSSSSCERSDDFEQDHGAQAATGHVSPNGIFWCQTVPAIRNLQRNIVRFHQGATYSPRTEMEAFHCFVTEPMLRTSLRYMYTNRRLNAVHKRPLTFPEMKAGITVVIRAGVDHNNLSSLSSLYTDKDSRP